MAITKAVIGTQNLRSEYYCIVSKQFKVSLQVASLTARLESAMSDALLAVEEVSAAAAPAASATGSLLASSWSRTIQLSASLLVSDADADVNEDVILDVDGGGESDGSIWKACRS